MSDSQDLDSTKQQLRKLLYDITGIDKTFEDPVDYAREIQTYYENILMNLPHNVYWKDTSLRYLGCNKQMARVVGSTPDAIKGKRDEDLVWKKEASILNQVDRQVIDNQSPLQIEETVQLTHGRKQTYLSNKAPLYLHDNQQVIGLVGISVNIAPLKRLETAFKKAKRDLEQANEMKNVLTSKITHDLRNPLSSILMMARQIQEGGSSFQEQSQYISAIITCSQQLLDLVGNLLQASQTGGYALSLDKKPFDLRDILFQIENELGIRARQDGTQFRLHIDDDVPNKLWGDATQLRRIIYNLSDNALKFTKQGYVDVEVSFLDQPTPQEVTLQFQVKDTGLGIPEDKLDNIFQDYQQLPSKEHMSSTQKWGGVGLGLSIVQDLVHAMGGQVRVNSKIGEGTVFWFNITFKKANDDSESNQEYYQAPNQQLDPSSYQARLLIVDDEPISRLAIKNLCEKHHCQVDEACDSQQALTKLSQGPYDLVFMDMYLGDKQGYDVVKTYFEQYPNADHQPVFYALTANNNENDLQSCIQAGMAGFIVKPLTGKRLRELIGHYLTNN